MRTMLTAVALGLMIVPGSVAHAGASPQQKCTDAKAKAAGKKAASLLKAFGKNISKNPDTKFAANISKAESKFTKAFSKAEARGGCLTNGDSGSIEDEINNFVLNVIGCPCCAAAPAAFAFETTVGSGTCGTLRNFRCDGGSGADFDFVFHACVDDGDPSECQFGPCSTLPFCNPPGKCCEGDFNISCFSDADCNGTCREQLKCDPSGGLCSTDSDCPATETCGASGGLPLDLDCGGLYTGGGLNTVPLPLAIPDKGVAVAAVTDCTNNTRAGPPGRRHRNHPDLA